MKTRIKLLAALVCCTLLSSSCAWGLFNTVQIEDNVSFGRAMIELKEAKEKGAITELEYEVEKKRFIEQQSKHLIKD
jgi:outer membrane lipopolysaccharide assembly protein LptE/RlpB